MKTRKFESYFAHGHMNKYKVLLVVANLFLGTKAYTQSLSPQVIATSGGYQSNAAGSLSFTIGETNSQTLTSTTHILTQGFQQPVELHLLQVKAFLQGYYVGSGQMTDVLLNEGVNANPSVFADTLQVELHDANSPNTVLFQTRQLIQQDGNIILRGLGAPGQSYFIVLKHRSGLETWSAAPVQMSAQTVYDFSTAASQAFGDNQTEVESGVYAMYTGDINQDGFVDSFDFPALDTDIFNGVAGVYVNTDLNGDGFVDGFDFPFLDINSFNGVSLMTP